MLTSGRLEEPPNDVRLLTNAPIVHFPGCTKATIAGPGHHLPAPRLSFVAVGRSTAGPAPQVSLVRFAGAKENVLKVAEAKRAKMLLREVWLENNRNNNTWNENHALPERFRKNGLNVQCILVPRERAGVIVGSALERDTNQVSDRILRLLLQIFCGRTRLWWMLRWLRALPTNSLDSWRD